MSRRSRRLTAEELQLWTLVARGVTPLKGRMQVVEATAAPEMTVCSEAPRLPEPEPPTVARTTPALPPLAPLDRRTVSAVRRGRRDIEGVIDLHGMRQNEAHDALRGFLHRSQGAGHKLVLVITGKGAPVTQPGSFEERRVLRRVVPHWLRLPDLRPLVVGFEEAAPHHGGGGALYVRLRRATRRGG
jgi:DNA-nicking Smr family endonuclease